MIRKWNQLWLMKMELKQVILLLQLSVGKMVSLNRRMEMMLRRRDVEQWMSHRLFEKSARIDQVARKFWTPSDDVLLISSWLNTSKDPVIGNEQKHGAFWKRVAAYFTASCKEKSEIRSSNNCKQRWHKIYDLMSKFSGAYDAANREKTSGQNENDVLKNAHQIFYNNHSKKFTLEHARKELRNDQKWCELSTSKTDVSSKRRRTDEASLSHVAGPEAELSTNRPPGVKAAKGKGKREGEGRVVSEFKQMWDIKAKDHAMKMLQILISKKEPLSECEEDLKRKLIADMMDLNQLCSYVLCKICSNVRLKIMLLCFV